MERLCDKLIVIKEGQTVFAGGFSDLQRAAPAGKQNILYLLEGKKYNLTVSSLSESQEEIKKLLAKGAVILSLQSEGGNLEQQYKELMKHSPPEKKQ